MLCSDRYNAADDWGAAAFLTVFALGPGAVTGRELAVFFAQTGSASRLGILFCSLLFGLAVFFSARMACQTGAANLPQIFRRSMGVYAGGTIWTLHAIALLIAGGLALDAAGKAAALMLPVRHARWLGLLLTVAIAIVSGRLKNRTAGLVPATALCMYLLLLLLRGELPPASSVYVHTKLRLENSARAAMLLGALYACRGAAVTATVAAAMGRRAKPARLGILSGGWMLLALILANEALRRHPVQLLALEQPFAAMASQWGKAGYFLSAGLLWLCAGCALAGVVFSLRSLLSGEQKKRC